MATTIKGSNLKPALLAKTGARKTTLKTAAELGGIAAKAAQNDLLLHLVVEQRPTASLAASALVRPIHRMTGRVIACIPERLRP